MTSKFNRKQKRLKLMKIKELLEEYGQPERNGVIDLGWVNGWGQKTNDLHDKLMAMMVQGTYYKSGSASNQRFTCVISDGDQEYKLMWSIDSSD